MDLSRVARRSPSPGWLVALVACACTGHASREERQAPRPEAPPTPEPTPEPPPEQKPPSGQEQPPAPPTPNCFSDRRDHALPFWPLNGVAADLDGDGRRDVVVNYSLDRRVGVHRGDGDGGLRKELTLDLQHDAVGLGIGDFDGDGRLDLAASDFQGAAVRVHRGRGDGTFEPVPQVTTVGKHVGGGVADDFDGDGRLDLAVPRWSALDVLRGRGDGTFTASRHLATGQAPENPLALDVSGDGRVDLVVPSNDEHHLAVLLGAGRGNFAPVARTPCGQGAHSLVAADFDRDGRIDVAMSSIHSSDVCVLLGDGVGGFRVRAVVPVGRTTYGVAAADLTGDAILDLVAIAWSPQPAAKPTSLGNEHLLGEGALFVLAGDGAGAFHEIAVHPVGMSPNNLWLDDRDSDGRLDALTLNSNGRSLTLLRGVACSSGG